MLRVREPRPPVVVVGQIASAQMADAVLTALEHLPRGCRVIMDGVPEDEQTRERTLTAAAVEELATARAGSRG
jgi:hypothetical protein